MQVIWGLGLLSEEALTPNGAGPFVLREYLDQGRTVRVRQHTVEIVEMAVAENQHACVLRNNLVRG